MYTDGSINSHYGGSGVVITRHGHIIKELIYHLGEVDIFQAEAYAVKAAATWLLTERCGRVTFYLDNSSVIKALTGKLTTSKLISDARKVLANLSERLDTSFVKVKAHSGMWGNDRADLLAKRGAILPITMAVDAPNPAWTVVKRRILATTLKIWKDRWRERTDCRQTKIRFPCIDKLKSANILRYNRLIGVACEPRKEKELSVSAMRGPLDPPLLFPSPSSAFLCVKCRKFTEDTQFKKYLAHRPEGKGGQVTFIRVEFPAPFSRWRRKKATVKASVEPRTGGTPTPKVVLSPPSPHGGKTTDRAPSDPLVEGALAGNPRRESPMEDASTSHPPGGKTTTRVPPEPLDGGAPAGNPCEETPMEAAMTSSSRGSKKSSAHDRDAPRGERAAAPDTKRSSKKTNAPSAHQERLNDLLVATRPRQPPAEEGGFRASREAEHRWRHEKRKRVRAAELAIFNEVIGSGPRLTAFKKKAGTRDVDPELLKKAQIGKYLEV